MAYLISRGASGDLAIRFNKRKKFLKEVKDLIDQSEATGCYVVVSVTTEPESNYEQEYKKMYRHKTLKDRGNDIKKEISLLKALLGWG